MKIVNLKDVEHVVSKSSIANDLSNEGGLVDMIHSLYTLVGSNLKIINKLTETVVSLRHRISELDRVNDNRVDESDQQSPPSKTKKSYSKMNQEQIQQIASICHEANKSYCLSIGDTSQPHWVDAPGWQVDSAIFGVNFHLSHPGAGTSDSHDSWMRQKAEDGWVYGEIKDPEAKTHPCIVPYSELPLEQRMKDFIFRGIVHAMRDGFES